MRWKSSSIFISFVVITISGSFVLADCPSADLNGDCFVDFEDFALMAAQWPNECDWNDVNTLATQWLTGYSNIPNDMLYIPNGEFEMGDHFSEGEYYERPVHAVFVDAFFMSKYEITNQQYCDYLNSAVDGGEIKVDDSIVYASSDSSNSYPYCDTSTINPISQIVYNGVSGTFSVGTKGEPPRDMSDDPMVVVSWHGAAAYCNWRSDKEGYPALYDHSDPNWSCDFSKLGYRLATEAEWEYAGRGGEHSPYYRFPWGDTITHSQANYYSYQVGGSPYYPYDLSPTSGFHPDHNDISPYTAPVGSFSPNGYGLYDMSGNVWEWCNDWFDLSYYDASPYDNPQGPASGDDRVVRGGSWGSNANNCRVVSRSYYYGPVDRGSGVGFRVVLDLPPLPETASDPYPAYGANLVSITTDLSWAAGSYATSHDVYFGTSSPPSFIGNQSLTTFDPGTMAYGIIYNWRIDEVNSSGITPGIVWRFTTEPTPPPPPE